MRSCSWLHPYSRALLLITLLITGTCAAGQIDIHGPAGSVAFGFYVIALPNGNVVVVDPNATVGGLSFAGAVYLYRPDGTLVSTLVGGTQGDSIGAAVGQAHIVVLKNGNFVVPSPYWQNTPGSQAGAVTFADANTGWGTGDTAVVSALNSLVGSQISDMVGSQGVTALSDGNYVVSSPNWANAGTAAVGAATWGSGTVGVSGAVGVLNSLTGTAASDQVGYGVTALTNGHYVVSSSGWNGARGAATWISGGGVTADTVSASNSLVGSTAFDGVGARIVALTNGNYVVASSNWNGGLGAATWVNGSNGQPNGAVSAGNSLTGTLTTDTVSSDGVTALTNGNYIVASSNWNNTAGAATWGNGNGGTVGSIPSNPSIVGSAANDYVGYYGAVALSNGNYAVNSPYWNGNRGAVTWGNGATGTNATVASGNSLIGSAADDGVGSQIVALTNGNYVVGSPAWSGNIGAVTWSNGANGNPKGAVAVGNSLHGSSANDTVGSYLVALTNGNYVAFTSSWNGGRGAATWGIGSAATTGAVSSGNSLVGSAANDAVGSNVIALSNGNYAVTGAYWDNGVATDAGAFTWGNGKTGTKGAVSTSNSVYGQLINDYVGNGNLKAFAYGIYAVQSGNWSDNGVFQGGAVTALLGDKAYPGPITSNNSVFGGFVSGGGSMSFDYSPARDLLVVGRPGDTIVTLRRVDVLFDDDFEQH